MVEFIFLSYCLYSSYYNLGDVDQTTINRYLSSLVERAIVTLTYSHCVQLEDDQRTVVPLTLGKICSYYYLSHHTAQMFKQSLSAETTVETVIEILAVRYALNFILLI